MTISVYAVKQNCWLHHGGGIGMFGNMFKHSTLVEDSPCLKGVSICRVGWCQRSSQDSNLGPLNSGQILLPISYWRSGIGAKDRWHLSIDTVRFSGWIFLGLICSISIEILCATTNELGINSIAISSFNTWSQTTCSHLSAQGRY